MNWNHIHRAEELSREFYGGVDDSQHHWTTQDIADAEVLAADIVAESVLMTEGLQDGVRSLTRAHAVLTAISEMFTASNHGVPVTEEQAALLLVLLKDAFAEHFAEIREFESTAEAEAN